MNTPTSPDRYKNHRFPAEIISHSVWLYYRFCLSYRDIKELLFVRGVIVSYEAIRKSYASLMDPLRDFTAEGVSRSSPFLTFRPPGLFATQISPTATAYNRRAAVTFPSEQNLYRYLHRHRIC